MRDLKKTVILLMTFSMVFALTACADNKRIETDEAEVAEVAEAAEAAEATEVTEATEVVEVTDAAESTEDTSTHIAEETDISRQMQLIAENKAIWLNTDGIEMYGYAVTDLDQNGRLEIIASSCQGTGMYTYTDIWEVDEALDGLELCVQEREEGDSQADIMVATSTAFYDQSTNNYYYIFEDVIRNGAAEYYENKRAVSLQKGQLLETILGYRETVYLSNQDAEITCTDAADTLIGEEEYEEIENQVFAGYEKYQVDFGWMMSDTNDFEGISVEKAAVALKNSYEAFAFYTD